MVSNAMDRRGLPLEIKSHSTLRLIPQMALTYMS